MFRSMSRKPRKALRPADHTCSSLGHGERRRTACSKRAARRVCVSRWTLISTRAMPLSLTTIGFDADDTLWQNEHFFRLTEGKFLDLLGAHGEREAMAARLLEAEKRNLALYGFGIKGFTLSMIETAIEITEGRVSAATIAEILAAGREMLRHPGRDAARCPRDACGAGGRLSHRADHQGRPLRPGAETRRVGPGRTVLGGRDRDEEGRRHLCPHLRRARRRGREEHDGGQFAPLRHRAGDRGRELGRLRPPPAHLGGRARRGAGRRARATGNWSTSAGWCRWSQEIAAGRP